MKKSIKVLFVMFLIISLLNIIPVQVKAYYWDDINKMSPEEIRSMDDNQLAKYLSNLGKAINSVPSDQEDAVTDAYNKLNGELRRRNNNRELNEVLNMTDMEIQNLTDRELRIYISSLEDCQGSVGVDNNQVNQALSRLQQEYQKRNSDWYHGYTPSTPTDYSNVVDIASNILGIIRNLGIVIAIIALSIMGVKYMVGSVEQKADYKKAMVPFVIGVILLAAGTTLVKIIYDAVTTVGL